MNTAGTDVHDTAHPVSLSGLEHIAGSLAVDREEHLIRNALSAEECGNVKDEFTPGNGSVHSLPVAEVADHDFASRGARTINRPMRPE
jgi:hypothetical protein